MESTTGLSERGTRQRRSAHPVFSVAKTLTDLLSVSSNRSCADCRSTLVDVSQVHASVNPEIPFVSGVISGGRPAGAGDRVFSFGSFHRNHQSFAPPALAKSKKADASVTTDTESALSKIPVANDPPVDPAVSASARVGGHGVFVCGLCAAAHKLLGPSVAIVHPIQDTTSWSPADVKRLGAAGGNARATTVLEAFMTPDWESKRPKADSGVGERLTFIRAKYEALAFTLPLPGPLAFMAWRRIVSLHPEWKGLWEADLSATTGFDGAHSEKSSLGSASRFRKSSISFSTPVATRKSTLPDRLVDYFCVVTPSDYVDPSMLRRDISGLATPEDIVLVPKILDCFPVPDTHKEDHEFPEHVSTFLFPDGCHPSSLSLPPSFFTFVLTSSGGDRLYGGVLTVYDVARDMDYVRSIFKNSGYKGPLPSFLSTAPTSLAGSTRSNKSDGSDVVFLPKCLVVLSHHPFFDLWRKFLLQLYRISLVEAPLPIERFIANFACEIPLPPPGKIQIKCGFTVRDTWVIQRPPENQLPMTDFSFKPLFTCLSVPNVMIVLSCLLQESRVALASRHYSLLGPVAEALTSLLFPLHWEGMYLPVMPYSMLDILDAPVPYLVGLHSRYLVETPPLHRPNGVIFVDLDKDEVALGFEDDCNKPREIPALPEKQAAKLKAKLEEFASNVYIVPPNGRVGTITTGGGEVVPLSRRSSYLQTAHTDNRPKSMRRRRDVFRDAEKAYRDNDLLVPISGFLSEHGQFYKEDDRPTNNSGGKIQKQRFPFLLRRSRSFESLDADRDSGTLLDLSEPHGFSSEEIRAAFLRFFVSLLQNYRQYLDAESFQAEDFLSSLNLSANSTRFVQSVIKTQMFDRFLEERRENQDDPEVKFFDESISAKINRSKKTALANIGRHAKKATPFLEDTSAAVTNTFTPPPPSNWGLPDDGRKYSYGVFPKLNQDLFGKTRAPRKWTESRRASLRMSRRTTISTQVGEHFVYTKAMAPTILSGSFLIAATRKGARNLENAIHALSSPFSGNNHSNSVMNSRRRDRDFGDGGSNVSDLTLPSELGISADLVHSAEEVVRNARRKQSILLGIVSAFQLQCRRKLGGYRATPGQQDGEVSSGSSVIEAPFEVIEEHAARILQCCLRRHLSRLKREKMRVAATYVQSLARGRRARFAFDLVRNTVIRLQAQCRGYLSRQLLWKAFRVRMREYRSHIFLLWKQSCESLCYRTKFWSIIQKDCSFISVVLAESEIRRLWNELGIQPPIFVEDNIVIGDIPCLKDNFRTGTSFGLLWQTLSLNGKSKPLTNVKIDPPRVAAERIQIYDRLSTATLFAHEDRLVEYFTRFSVPSEKHKKVALSEVIWNDPEKADASTAFMYEIFPELKDSTNIRFKEPSKKAVRRFRSSGYQPAPLDKSRWAHNFRIERTRRHVVEVADLSLRVVPRLSDRLSKLDAHREEHSIHNANRQEALMKSMDLFPWRKCRIVFMKSYVASSTQVGSGVPALKNTSNGVNGHKAFDSLTQEAISDTSKSQRPDANGVQNSKYPGTNFWEGDSG